MAIPLLSGFEIKNVNPVDERFILTKAEMLAQSDSYMPDKYFCVCSDDGKIYTYAKTNSVSETTGKFRVVEGGGSVGAGSWGSITGTLEDQTDLKTALDGKVDVIEGKGLSTEDFTTDLKTKLDNLSEVTANVADEATDALSKLKVGDTVFSISGGSGASAAEAVTYSNATYTDWTNVKKALDGIIEKMDYEKPAVSSFFVTPDTEIYEVGQTVTSLNFAWSYNKDISSQTLTDVELADSSVRSASWIGSITSDKTFTLSASDGKNSCIASKTISFKNKIYYGSAAIPDTFDSAFILGLSNSKFASDYKGSYGITVSSSKYGFICSPVSMSMPEECYIGGFLTTLVNCGSISFTNSSGGTTNYNIYRTTQASLGSITLEFK